jgi:predicted ester cyclase
MTGARSTPTPVEFGVAEDFYMRWLDAWNQDDVDRVFAIVTDDFVLSSPTTRLTGLQVCSATDIRDYIKYIRTAYPDLLFEQRGPAMYAFDAPIVSFPWRGTGTFTGTLAPPGIAGTGRRFDFRGVEVFTFRNDRACSLFASYDLLRMMRQIAVLDGSWAPEPGSA